MQPDIFEHHQPKDPPHHINGHRSASIALRNFEGALRNMLRGWVEYADAHDVHYSAANGERSLLGSDYVIGPEWLTIGHALLELLNGETGRFDCGSLHRNIKRAMREAGFSEDEVNT